MQRFFYSLWGWGAKYFPTFYKFVRNCPSSLKNPHTLYMYLITAIFVIKVLKSGFVVSISGSDFPPGLLDLETSKGLYYNQIVRKCPSSLVKGFCSASLYINLCRKNQNAGKQLRKLHTDTTVIGRIFIMIFFLRKCIFLQK